jgi:hypothetical protein
MVTLMPFISSKADITLAKPVFLHKLRPCLDDKIFGEKFL